jgi:hypothetical protein
MKEFILLGAAGVVGLVTFWVIAKKFGSSCTP